MVVKLVSATPAPTDRERIWAAIRELGRFTSLEIAVKTGIPRKGFVIGEYLKGLERAGFLRVISEKKRGASYRYELARDVGVDAPRVNKAGGVLPPSGRTRMWRAMRILGTFTARELAAAAHIAEAPVAVAEADYYCKWLCRGGYLRGDGKRWTFVPAMNTGPKAPQVLRVKKLYDPNRDAVICESKSKAEDGGDL
jgi:hypothetical protein